MAKSTDKAVGGQSKQARGFLKELAASPMADSYLITFCTVILCTLGALMVLSASSAVAAATMGSPYHFAIRHVAFLVVGTIGAVIMSRMKPKTLRRFGWLGWLIAVVLLILVLSPLGHEYQGNQNWIMIGSYTFQPSEFAKLALIVWCAALYHRKSGQLHDPWQLLIPLIPGAGLILALVLAGKDLGTGLVIGILILALLFFVGTPLRLMIPGTIASAALVVFLVLGSPNRMSRIEVFLNPESNTDLSSQPMAALYALASGGWWGLGLGASKQKWGGLKDAPHTDFIFAVIGEELGLLGVLLLLALFALLIRAGISVALHSNVIFNRLVAAGVTAWFGIQALINIMVVMHLLPVLGVPLPFISSGGSSLIANLLAVGALLACARDTPEARRYLAAKKRARPRMTSVLADGKSK